MFVKIIYKNKFYKRGVIMDKSKLKVVNDEYKDKYFKDHPEEEYEKSKNKHSGEGQPDWG